MGKLPYLLKYYLTHLTSDWCSIQIVAHLNFHVDRLPSRFPVLLQRASQDAFKNIREILVRTVKTFIQVK